MKLNSFRNSRARLFVKSIKPRKTQTVLDLGGGDGSYINEIIKKFPDKLNRKNIVVADYDIELLDIANKQHDFKTKIINADFKLPFKDKSFDIVLCNSVIEHVTGNKKAILGMSNKVFKRKAFVVQQAFAKEIARVGKSFFVQTPNKYFLVESHTLMPVLFIFLPRNIQILIGKIINWLGIRHIHSDWNLLSYSDMETLFPEAKIYKEKYGLFVKSLVAVKK